VTAEDARYAAELLEALDHLPDVRKGLKDKPDYGAMHLEIAAYEREGDSGGTSHGSALLPIRIATRILICAELAIMAELERLGVDLPEKAQLLTKKA
jgi:hypothetical protein